LEKEKHHSNHSSKENKTMKNAMHTSIPLRHTEPRPQVAAACRILPRRCLGFSLIALACFAFLPRSRAVTPAPDGAYPNENTAEGGYALLDLTSGSWNTALGFRALRADTTGSYNTATGADSLFQNIDGEGNTATGTFALTDNTHGSYNTASGYSALSNSSASNNTATGANALLYNTIGTQNTATGARALYGVVRDIYFPDSTGSYNTATGFEALFSNRDGAGNVADGWQALYKNQSGPYNTATGVSALRQNTTGGNNTASGVNALYYNNGTNNTATGANSLQSNSIGNNNTAHGAFALFYNTNAANNNVALGYQAGYNLTTGSNNIVIGAGVLGAAGDANKIRIGKSTHTATLIGGIYNKTVASGTGVAVRIDSTGKLGTVLSSARYKEAIRPMDKASEAILALEPVTFRYKQDLDPDGVTQFGLIAEQVEKVNPDLVVRDEDGKVSTVRYEAVNAMLLNEFLKEHRKVQDQQATIAELKSAVADQKVANAKQQKQIEALTGGLQKVNARIELEKPFPRRVTANNYEPIQRQRIAIDSHNARTSEQKIVGQPLPVANSARAASDRQATRLPYNCPTR
jgi:uncharacterized coiled-coil protein SlyX